MGASESITLAFREKRERYSSITRTLTKIKGERMTEDEKDESEIKEEKRLEDALEKRRKWLRNLSQIDRDYISRFGEENWRKWKVNQK